MGFKDGLFLAILLFESGVKVGPPLIYKSQKSLQATPVFTKRNMAIQLTMSIPDYRALVSLYLDWLVVFPLAM